MVRAAVSASVCVGLRRLVRGRGGGEGPVMARAGFGSVPKPRVPAACKPPLDEPGRRNGRNSRLGVGAEMSGVARSLATSRRVSTAEASGHERRRSRGGGAPSSAFGGSSRASCGRREGE
eukprot:642472-Prymnesium_polylepis.1